MVHYHKQAVFGKFNPSYQKSIEIRGIKKVVNRIDNISTNRNEPLREGECVGKIIYLDGREEDICYRPTGKNTVKYFKARTGRGSGNCAVIIKPDKKQQIPGQVEIWNFI